MSSHSRKPPRRARCSRARHRESRVKISPISTSASRGPCSEPFELSDETTTQKLSTEGADPLTLAGVNDANLIELSRLGGVRVGLRGDTLAITGPTDFVERA